VIANIYWQGRWNRMETWHLPCYVAAGFPYGRLDSLNPVELEDLMGLLEEGIEPTSDLIIVRMAQMSKARKDPAYRPPVVH
jgi:hypothetical protein